MSSSLFRRAPHAFRGLRFAALVLAAFAFGTGTAIAQDPPLSVHVIDSVAEPGDAIDVQVIIGTAATPVPELSGVGFVLTFDSSVLTFLGHQDGALFASTIAQGGAFDVIETQRSGEVDYSVSLFSAPQLTNVTGEVARFQFEVQSDTPDGTYRFSLREAVRARRGSNPDSNIPIATTNGDDIVVNEGGLPLDIVVWPGDTNEDNTVDQADVLPLGLNWGTTGPARTSISCQWQSWSAQPWSTESVTHADANGDGAVDQSDVLCIGLNWGQAVSTPSSSLIVASALHRTESSSAMLRVAVTRPSIGDDGSGEPVWVTVHAEDAPGLLGTAFELSYPAEQWTVAHAESGNWLGSDALLHTHTDRATGLLGVGITRRRTAGPASGSSGEILRVKFRRTGAASGGEIAIKAPSGSFASGRVLDLKTGAPAPLETFPDRFVVLGNAPNPFHSQTQIRYVLPGARDVRVEIFDILGRRRAKLIDERQAAGAHTVEFHGEALPSGTYFARVTAGAESTVYPMRLIK